MTPNQTPPADGDRNEEKQDQSLTITDTGLIEIGHRAEKLAQAIKQVRAAVLTITNPRDWENLGERPYLNDGGAAKVGQAFGVSTRFLQYPEREDYEDGHYDYTCIVEVTFRGVTVEEGGTGSSRDPFFSKSKGEDIPPSEIDRNDVKKKSITNATGRAVKRILALKNFTWEELNRAGVKKEEVSSVDYGGVKLPNYGRCAKQLVSDALDEDLRWYADSLKKSIANPERANFKASNQKILQAIDLELERRAKTAESEKPPEEAPKSKAKAPSQPAVQHPNPPEGEPPDYVVDDHAWNAAVDEMEQDSAAFKVTKEKLKVNLARQLQGEERVHFVNTFRDVAQGRGKK